MDAIELLEQQHKEVEALFAKVSDEQKGGNWGELFAKIGDALAVHAAIEEKIFYPAALSKETNKLLIEATEEHLAAKRLIADLIELSPDDEHFPAKLVVLKEEIRHHIAEERKELFPEAHKLLNADQREALGQSMEAMAADLKAGSEAPRMHVPAEIAEAARLRPST